MANATSSTFTQGFLWSEGPWGLGALGAGVEEEWWEGEDQQSPHLGVAGILDVHLAASLVSSQWGIRTNHLLLIPGCVPACLATSGASSRGHEL